MMNRNASRLIIVAILLLAFGLRLTQLGHQELRGVITTIGGRAGSIPARETTTLWADADVRR